MLIVPLAKDHILTKDDVELDVIEYTNFKSKGPALYCSAPSDVEDAPPRVVYFFDIEKLNGVKVQFVDTQKVLRALGVVKRKYHLPQPHDTIVVLDHENDMNNDELTVRVEKLKLHAREEISRGLQICCDNDKCYRLEDVVELKHALGGSHFDRKKFLKYYEDYRGHITK